MCQNDLQFIGILNRFRTTMQTEYDIAYINRLCYGSLPTDTTFLHLFYTNIETNEHNKYAFDNTLDKTYKFVAKDIPSKTFLRTSFLMYRALLTDCMLKYASNRTCWWNCVQETMSLVTMEYLKTLPLLPRAWNG
jgi:hypothetical protein